MMGDTGPCGPCSELHVDLTPAGDTEGALVNKGDARCIEIWNLVFIQFNANPDGTFSPLPAKHVDTGMGFERVTSIIQGTQNLTDFANAKISNYETDIFRPIFDELEKLSGKKYGSTLPGDAVAKVENTEPLKTSGEARGNIIEVEAEERGAHSSTPCDDESDSDNAAPTTEQIQLDIAFRVIADHIRTLSFAIADGIQPGNNDRNYVLRRILRRAVRYGRTLGFHEPFFYKLVDVLAETMGDVFPEIRARKKQVQETIRTEEEAFNKTLDAGIKIFEQLAAAEFALIPIIENGLSFVVQVRDEAATQITIPAQLQHIAVEIDNLVDDVETGIWDRTSSQTKKALALWAQKIVAANLEENLVVGFNPSYVSPYVTENSDRLVLELENSLKILASEQKQISSLAAFLLYDTKGFPLDLTELMARERGLTVDKEGFEKLMEEQRTRARAAQKKEVISLSQIETTTPTKFVGYDNLAVEAKVLEVVRVKAAVGVQASACPPNSLKAGLQLAVILDASACYAEMGGQVGDTGELSGNGQLWRITNTQKSGNTFLHFVESGGDALVAGSQRHVDG